MILCKSFMFVKWSFIDKNDSSGMEFKKYLLWFYYEFLSLDSAN
jgi:hypothetical protein